MKKYTVMKKFLTMTLACAMTLSLAACGSKTDTAANGNDSQQRCRPAGRNQNL